MSSLLAVRAWPPRQGESESPEVVRTSKSTSCCSIGVGSWIRLASFFALSPRKSPPIEDAADDDEVEAFLSLRSPMWTFVTGLGGLEGLLGVTLGG